MELCVKKYHKSITNWRSAEQKTSFFTGRVPRHHIQILRCIESAWEWVGFVAMDMYDCVWDHLSTSHPFNRSSPCIYDEKITHFHM